MISRIYIILYDYAYIYIYDYMYRKWHSRFLHKDIQHCLYISIYIYSFKSSIWLEHCSTPQQICMDKNRSIIAWTIWSKPTSPRIWMFCVYIYIYTCKICIICKYQCLHHVCIYIYIHVILYFMYTWYVYDTIYIYIYNIYIYIHIFR